MPGKIANEPIETFKKNLKKRIMLLSVSSGLLLFTILTLSLSIVLFIGAFDFIYNNKPKIVDNFNDKAWRFRKELDQSEKNIKSIISQEKELLETKSYGISNNLASLESETKAAKASLDNYTAFFNKNSESIFQQYLNEKRLLFIFAGVVIIFVIKLLSDIYRYSKHTMLHYTSIYDAINLSISDNDNKKIDIEKFKLYLEIIKTSNIQIPESKTILESLLQKNN